MPITVNYTIAYALASDFLSGSVTVTDTTDYVGQGLTASDCELCIGFSVLGVTYRYALAGQAGNILHTPGFTATYALPTNSTDGKVLGGTYTFSTRLVSPIGPIDEVQADTESELCLCYPEISVQPTTDCHAALVTLTDATDWVGIGWTVNSRLLTLHYPRLSFHADITGTGTAISTPYGESILSGFWTWEAAWSVTKDNVTVAVSRYDQFEVTCSAAACVRWCEIGEKLKLIRKEELKNSASSLAVTMREQLEQMVLISSMIAGMEGCGQTVPQALHDEWASLASGCGCGCGDITDVISPAYGSAASMWLPVAGTWITITPGLGIYTFSVSQTLIDIVNALYNTEVISSDGSITITDSTVGLVKTFDLSATKAPTDSMEFRWTVTPPGAFAISVPTIIGTTFQVPVINPTAGGFYAVTGLFTGAPFPVNVQVSILEVSRKAPYDNTHRYNILVDPQVFFENNTFTIGLIADDALFLTNRGQAKDATFYAKYISSMEILFVITKK